MSRRVIGYIDGRPQWEDLGPAEYIAFGTLGGSAIEARPSQRRGEPSSSKAIRAKVDRDYHESVLKGHATRKLRGEGLEP